LTEPGTRLVFGTQGLKKFAIFPPGAPLLTNKKGRHASKPVIVKEAETGRLPQGVEERLPKWARILLELEAQARAELGPAGETGDSR